MARENLRDLLYDGKDPDYEFETQIERLHRRTPDRMTRAICRVDLGLPLSQVERDMLDTNGTEYSPQMAAADLADIFEDNPS